MSRFIPYRMKESQYPLWLERDIDLALKDQKKMGIILFFMIIGVVEVILFYLYQLTFLFLVGSTIACILTSLAMIPIWKHAKNWVNDLRSSFYLRAISDDEGYYAIRSKIIEILNKTEVQYRQAEHNFQAIIGTNWYPKEEIILSTGELKIVELSFDITKEEGLELKLNSLSKFPRLENKLINGLDNYFKIELDGKITIDT